MSLIKLPFQTTDLEITLSSNVWEVYKAALIEQRLELQQGIYRYFIDRTTRSMSARTNAKWDSWEEWYEMFRCTAKALIFMEIKIHTKSSPDIITTLARHEVLILVDNMLKVM